VIYYNSFIVRRSKFTNDAGAEIIVAGAKSIIIWIGFVIMLGCASSQPQSSSHHAVLHDGDWYMEEGINAFARNDYDQAIMLWENAAPLLPRNARLLNFIGLAQLRSGHDGKASLAFEKAIEFDPGFAEAYNNLGYVMFRQRQYDQAMEFFQRAFAIDPEYVEARQNFKLALEASSGNLDGWAFTLAEEAVRTEDLDQKIALFSHALEVDPNSAMIHNNLGVALYYNGEIQRSVSELQRAVEIDPGLAEGFNNVGFIYIDLAEYAKAIEQFQIAVDIDPTYIVAYNNMGRAFVKYGEIDRAIAVWEYALSIQPANRIAQRNLVKYQNDQ
jgi:superkiller protein 3